MSVDQPNVSDAAISHSGRIESVRQSLARLADINDLPLREHHASYERMHESLRDALSDLDR